MRRTLSAVAASLLTTVVSAQSINIDFGVAAGVPDASYAAAGQPGAWNAIDGVTLDPQPLAGLNGLPTNVTIAGNFVEIGPALQNDDRGTTGNDEALMDDFLPGSGDVVIGFRIDGLAPGVYDVIAYGWGPNQANPGPLGFDGTCIEVFESFEGGSTTGCMGGAWPGALAEGVTHVVARVETATGTIHAQYYGNYWGASGFFNGLQIVDAGGGLVPCLCDTDNDGASDVFDLLAYLDDWFAGDADVNNDTATDVHDLLAWLDCFFTGC